MPVDQQKKTAPPSKAVKLLISKLYGLRDSGYNGSLTIRWRDGEPVRLYKEEIITLE